MSDRHVNHAVCNAILWLLIVVYAFVTVVADAFPGIFGSKLNLPLSIIVPLVFAVLHGAIRYRITGIIIFLVLCLGISNLMENIGVMTGFPFGPYHYTDVLGPKLFLVPILIGPAYFGTGYVSWLLGNVLLGTDARRDSLATILVPAIAAFIMVGWDVCLDPGSSTIGHIWIWHKGGGYFGVPFTNYLGWYLTVYLFLQAFALYRAWWPETVVPVLSRAYWYQACVLFAVMGLDYLAGYYGGTNTTITDAAGHAWQTGDIFETGAIVCIYTMLFVAAASVAVILLGRGPRTSDQH
jgi:putative membrane protein